MNASLRTADNISKVLVAKCAAAHGLADGTLVESLADGIVAVVRPDNTIVAMTGDTILGDSYITGGGAFRIVQGTGVGSPLKVSPLLTSGSYTLSGSKFAAETQQVSYIGFNGTSGAIDAADANTSYYITVIMNNPNEADRSQPRRLYGQYTTPASGQTDALSTKRLTENLIKNFGKLKDDNLLVERTNSGTNTALGTGVDNVVFTNGSKTVSATDIDNATANAALAVGELIRVGTADTDPVYAIVSIDTAGNTLELDIPFQGATTTLADTALERVTVANLGDWGIKLSGEDRSFDVAKNRNNYTVRFTLTTSDSFNVTPLTTTVKAFEGAGTAEQAAMAYYEGEGFEGTNDLIGVPPGARNALPTPITSEYAVLNFAISNTVGSVVSNSTLRSNLIVYLEYSDGSTGGTDGDVSANGESIVGTTATYDA